TPIPSQAKPNANALGNPFLDPASRYAYTPAPQTSGLQIAEQQLQLALGGPGKRMGNVSSPSDLWLECSANLICSMREHLHAGSDPQPGPPIFQAMRRHHGTL
ncbi:hypothetical protein H0H87_009017, partial [Tephrocybe sp. NHM501043]